MTAEPRRTPREIRAELGHPVVDVDGHVLEFMPAAMPYVRESLGEDLYDQYVALRSPLKSSMSVSDVATRRDTRHPQLGWWASPVNNPKDLATSIFPSLLHERVEELGIDLMVLFATNTMGSGGIGNEDLRRGVCRGFNDFFASTYGPYNDRLLVAGMIPMVTPEEAIAELEHCHDIGLKVVTIPHCVMRPIKNPQPGSPFLWPNQTHWLDYFGFESEYDYDPVWAKFRELGFAVCAHGGVGAPPPDFYSAVTSWMYNHIGSFAAMMYPLCKSLFLGGVTKRFPDVNFAFMECGVAWASSLLADTVEHWERRNITALREHYDPSKLDRAALVALARQYGQGLVPDGLSDDELSAMLGSVLLTGLPPDNPDEFSALGIDDEEELRDLFVNTFYFGCESDDRTAAFAYSDANAFGAHLKPMFSSDISHFDVPEMSKVMPSAHSLLRDGLMTEAQFRDFMFENAVRLHGGPNPDFFKGTAIEKEAGEVLAAAALTGATSGN
jgi:predicted TIM-barrel fold metal-dependent hydrolase